MVMEARRVMMWSSLDKWYCIFSRFAIYVIGLQRPDTCYPLPGRREHYENVMLQQGI